MQVCYMRLRAPTACINPYARIYKRQVELACVIFVMQALCCFKIWIPDQARRVKSVGIRGRAKRIKACSVCTQGEPEKSVQK